MPGLYDLKVLVATAVLGLLVSLLLWWSPLVTAFLVCLVAIVLGIAQNEDYLDYEPDLGLLSFL